MSDDANLPELNRTGRFDTKFLTLPANVFDDLLEVLEYVGDDREEEDFVENGISEEEWEALGEIDSRDPEWDTKREAIMADKLKSSNHIYARAYRVAKAIEKQA